VARGAKRRASAARKPAKGAPDAETAAALDAGEAEKPKRPPARQRWLPFGLALVGGACQFLGFLLLKGVDARGFSFFTNYRSAKGRGLEASGRGALTFYWGDLLRQVRAQGAVQRLSDEESDEYFRSRPRGSQIGAWASAQSEPLESREVLEARAREVEVRFAGGEIPRPAHWGGYLLIPHEIEFWQEGESRLHDRFRYRRIGDGPWTVERLNP
jgi:pyridoxamine 5'-phosphate oxidase